MATYISDGSPSDIQAKVNETISAPSRSVADVQAAIDSAAAGDTVTVPAGDVTWSGGVTISKSLTLIGTGVNITRASGNTSSLIAVKNLPSDVPVRVSGFSFDNGLVNKNGSQNTYDVAVYGGSSTHWTKIRVDNCTFRWGSRPMAWIGWVAGVTDHCTFINSIRSFYLLGNNSESWKRIPDVGSADFVFCEDCTFKIDNNLGGTPNDLFAAYHEQGSGSVMRHCTIDGAANTNSNDGFYDAHGSQTYWSGTSNDFRSTHVCEFYENTIHLYNNYRCADLRGGSFLWYNNSYTIDASSPAILNFREEEGSAGDKFNPLRTGPWPCEDQINNTYIWGNTVNGSPSSKVGGWYDSDSKYIQQDRDYFLHAPDGTKVSYPQPGHPSKSNYPTVYKSIPASYKAYTYPHPLVSGEGLTPTPTPSPTATPSPTPTPTPNPTAPLSSVIPADRRIEWSAGVRGGIPNRTNLINVKNAPYNARGDGSADDKGAIQQAINDANAEQVVYLPSGTYKVSGTLTIDNKSISLRGAGAQETTIRYEGSSGIDIVKATRGSAYGGAIAITGGMSKDSTQLSVSSGSGLSVGNVIWISQKNDPDFVSSGGYNGVCSWCGRDDPNRVMTQMNKIVGKNGNTVTLERPLYLSLSSNLSPTINTCATVHGVGIEDLRVERTNNNAGAEGSNIVLRLCDNSWVKNCASHNPGRRHIFIELSYACEVRECDLRSDLDWWHNDSDHNYGIFVFGINSDHLIEDNILFRCRHSMIYEGGGSGCVFAYNYAQGAVSEPDKEWLTEDSATHGAHPYMNLFEGNVTSKLSHDNTWGSASHNTSFRCHIVNWSSQNEQPYNARWAVDIQEHSYYNNVVGCVIGREGDQGERYAQSGISTSKAASYRLGFQCPGCGTITDSKVKQTTSLHGNYDYIGGGVVWDSTISEHNLPSSLYLKSKPAWWTTGLAWPAIGSDLNPMVSAIPAELRYKGEASPTPTPSPTPNPTPTPSPTPTPTPAPTPTPTPSPTPAPTPTPTPTPTATPSPTPAPTPSPTPPPISECESAFHIFDPGERPANESDPNKEALELGVHFTPLFSGKITAIRFYKGGGNSGTHVGSMWTSSGTLLGRVEFSGETGQGWQQASFSQPIAVSAGVTYVASYHAPKGHFAITQNYFVAAEQSGLFCLPANAGVYTYSSNPAFPTTARNGCNYWVDVTLVP